MKMRLSRPLLSALLVAALTAAAPAAVLAQTVQPAKSDKAAKTETKSDAKPEAKEPKKLTAQQQKMKDCGAKWQEEKKAKGVSGKAAYQTFLKGCLKG